MSQRKGNTGRASTPETAAVDMRHKGTNLRTTSCAGVSRVEPSGIGQKRADGHNKGGAANDPLPEKRVKAQEHERGTQPGRSYLRSGGGCNHRHASPSA